MTVVPRVETATPMWWREHAWNNLTMEFLRLQRRDYSVVALQTSFTTFTEGASMTAPPVEALPSILEFLRAKPVDSTETLFETCKRLQETENQPHNMENNTLARAYLLNVVPWTLAEAEEILDGFVDGADADSYLVGGHTFPDKRIAVSVYTLSKWQFLPMQAFVTNPHLLSLTSASGESWYATEVIDPLLDEISKTLKASDKENFSEYLGTVVNNPAVPFDQIEKIASVAGLALVTDQFREYQDAFFDHIELVLSGVDRGLMFEHRLAKGQKLTEGRARLLAKSRSQAIQGKKLFQLLTADNSSESLARELVRELILDKELWPSSQYALPMMGAVLHELYEQHDFSPDEVPLEWVLEVVA